MAISSHSNPQLGQVTFIKLDFMCMNNSLPYSE
jgi:hypothetical protein